MNKTKTDFESRYLSRKILVLASNIGKKKAKKLFRNYNPTFFVIETVISTPKLSRSSFEVQIKNTNVSIKLNLKAVDDGIDNFLLKNASDTILNNHEASIISNRLGNSKFDLSMKSFVSDIQSVESSLNRNAISIEQSIDTNDNINKKAEQPFNDMLTHKTFFNNQNGLNNNSFNIPSKNV
ncbi:hypothetical protein BB558_006007, partial [Smittium angustum]